MKISHLLTAAALLFSGTAQADDVLGFAACARLFAMTPSEKQELASAIKDGDKGRAGEIGGRGGLRAQACLAELTLAQAALAAARTAGVVK